MSEQRPDCLRPVAGQSPALRRRGRVALFFPDSQARSRRAAHRPRPLKRMRVRATRTGNRLGSLVPGSGCGFGGRVHTHPPPLPLVPAGRWPAASSGCGRFGSRPAIGGLRLPIPPPPYCILLYLLFTNCIYMHTHTHAHSLSLSLFLRLPSPF